MSSVDKQGVDCRKTEYSRKDFCRIQQQVFLYEKVINKEYLSQRLPYLLHYHLIRALAGKPSEKLNDAVNNLTHDLRLSYYPWLDIPESSLLQRDRDYIRDRMDLWQRIFGKLDDPETQDRLNIAIEHFSKK